MSRNSESDPRKRKLNSSYPEKKTKETQSRKHVQGGSDKADKSVKEKGSRKRNSVEFEFIGNMEALQKRFKESSAGHRADIRSFIADTARMVKYIENNELAVQGLYAHPFWTRRKARPPKNLMCAAMLFWSGRTGKSAFTLAQRRARVVEFLIHEGCELDDLEVALKEGLNKIYERAAKEDPRQRKKQRKGRENVPEDDALDDLEEPEDSKSKKEPKPSAKTVILTGTGVTKLQEYPPGKRLKLIVRLANSEDEAMEVIKVVPLKE